MDIEPAKPVVRVRRACTLFAVSRSALCYESRKAAQDVLVIEWLRALAAQYPLMAIGAFASLSLP